MKHSISNIDTHTKFYTMDVAASGSGIYFAGISWTPSPFVNISIEKYTAGDYIIGGIMNVNLNGVLHGEDFNATASELHSKIQSLASKNQCINDISIACGGTAIINNGTGWITSYNFPEGDQKNWANIIPYSISLSVLSDDGVRLVQPNTSLDARYSLANNQIKSIRENISFNMDDKIFQTFSPTGTGLDSDHMFSNEHIIVNYSLDVEGIGTCNSCASSGNSLKGGLEAAWSVISHRNTNIQTLSESTLFTCGSGVQIFPSGRYDVTKRYNHTRSITVDELNSSISINGQYIIRPTGVRGDILLTMDSNLDSSLENGEKNLTINGTITGLVENTFADSNLSVTNTSVSINHAAMEAAENQLYKLINEGKASGILDYLKSKNNLVLFNNALGDSKNPLGYGNDNDGSAWPTATDTWGGHDSNEYRLLTKSFKRNHTNNSIDFTLSYSNKNKHKIPYALWADINIEHEMPARRLAEHVVPGRGYPLMQDILCDTLDVYTITVNAQFEPTRNIHNVISAARETILLLINQTAIDLNADSWVRTGDSESVANNGSYRRTIKLTRHSCYDGATSSSSLPYVRMAPPNYVNAAGYTPSQPAQPPTITPRDLTSPTAPEATDN